MKYVTYNDKEFGDIEFVSDGTLWRKGVDKNYELFEAHGGGVRQRRQMKVGYTTVSDLSSFSDLWNALREAKHAGWDHGQRQIKAGIVTNDDIDSVLQRCFFRGCIPVPPGRQAKLSRARSRLYRSRFWEVNTTYFFESSR